MGFLFFSLFISFTAWGTIAVDQKYLETQIESAPSILSLQERITEAQKLSGSLRRSFLPKMKLIYGQERFTTGPLHRVNQPFGGIEAEVNLFNFGRDSLEDKRRSKEAQLAQVNSKITKAEILAKGREALAQYAYLNEISSILREAMLMNEKNISGAEKRIRAGLSTSTDLIDFQHQKIALNQEYETLKFEIGLVERLLAVILGHNPDQEVIVKFQNEHPEHGPLFNAPGEFLNSALIKKAELTLEIASLNKSKVSRWWGPRLDLYGYALRFTQKEREYPEPGQRNDVTFGFRFTLPFFDGGEAIAETQASSARTRALEYDFRQRILEVKNETGNALRKLDLAHNLIHGAEDSVKLMSEYRKGIMNEYTKGVKNSPDVLQANQRWIEAKTKFAEVKRNYQFAKSEAQYLISLSGG